MADIDLSLGFTIEQSSIRAIQSEINRALKDTSPQVNVELAPNFLKNLQDEIKTLPLSFSDITVDPGAIQSINQLIQENVTIDIKEIDIRQRAIDELERKIADIGRSLTVQSEIEIAREAGAVPSRGAIPKDVQSSANEAGLSTGSQATTSQGAIEELLKQRERLEDELIQAITERGLFEREATARVNKLQDKEIIAIQLLEDARADLRNELITAAQAQRVSNRLSTSDAAGERETAGLDTQTSGFREEREQQRSLLQKDIDALTASAQAEEKIAALNQQNSQIARLQNQLNTESITAKQAIKRASEIELDATIQGAAAAQRAKDALIATAQEQLATAQFIGEAKSAASQVARLLKIQEKLQEGFITAEQAKRAAFDIEVDARNRNAQLVSQAKTELENQIVAASQAEEATKTEATIQRQRNQLLEIARQLDEDIISADRAIVAAKKINIDATKAGADATLGQRDALIAIASSLVEIDRKNKERAATQAQVTALEQVQSELAAGLISTTRARLVVARTQLDASQQGSQAIIDARDALEEEVATQEKIVSINREREGAIKEAESRQKDISRALEKEFESIRAAERIQRDLENELITSREAQRQINRLSSKSSEQPSSAIPERTADAIRQTFNEALSAAQRFVDGVVTAENEQKQLATTIQEERKAASQVKNIIDRQKAGLLSAENARKKLDLIAINAQTAFGKSVQVALGAQKRRLDGIIQQESEAKAAVEAEKQELQRRRDINKALIRLFGSTSSQADSARNLANILRQEVADRQQLSGPSRGGAGAGAGAPGGGGGGSDVTFRNAADVENFVNQLDPSQLERFTSALGNTSSAVNGAQRATNLLGTTLRENNKDTSRSNQGLREGATLAENFGSQVKQAGIRLLAWAAPANLIFLTVTRLRSAVNEVIALDKESRRLIFFRNSGSIITQAAAQVVKLGDSSISVRELGFALKDTSGDFTRLINVSLKLSAQTSGLAKEFSLTASIARQYGLSIRTVQEALVTVARVGQQATDASSGAASAFTDAALSLVRLESGALGATEAVRGLVAIQAQFFGGRRGTVFGEIASDSIAATAAVNSVSNAAAILATTSAGSSASVSELTDAVTRLGSAFVNLQGLNFPQTVAILGEAFTATGATTGRLATALRQTATLIKQNAEEIRELTGVTVANADGTITGFQAILDVLGKVREAGEGLKATEISLLIADRRNIADISALAQNIDVLQASYDKFADPVERVTRVVAAQLALYNQNISLANSLEAQINNLGTAFKQLVDSEGLRDFLRDAVRISTNVVDALGLFVKRASVVSGVLAPLGAALAGITAKGIIGVVRGFIGAGRAASGLTNQVRAASGELNIQANNLSDIVNLRERGLIPLESGVTAAKELTRAQKQIAISSLEVDRIQKEIKRTESDQNSTVKQQIRLEGELETAVGKVAVARRKESKILRAASRDATAAAQEAQRKKRLNSAATGLTLAAASLVSVALEEAGQDGLAKGLSTALTTASIGFSVGGPIGAAIGGLIGFLGQGLSGVIKDAADTALSVQESFQGQARQGLTAANIGTDTFDLIQKINAAQGGFDEQGRKAAVAQTQRLQKLRAQLGILRLNEASGVQNDEDRARIVALRAQLTEEQNIAKENLTQVKQRQRGLQVQARAGELLKEVQDINLAIARGELKGIELVKAREVLAKNLATLGDEEFANLNAVVEARTKAAVATERQAVALRSLEREASIQDTIQDVLTAIPSTEDDALRLKFELDEASFERAIELAKKRVAILQQTASLQAVGSEEAEAAGKALVEAQEKVAELQIGRISDLVSSQKAIVDAAASQAEKQIQAWQKAALEVTKAFSNVVSEQKDLAAIFGKIGELNAANTKRLANSTGLFLERTGASVAERLAFAAQTSERQLATARGTFDRQSSTLGDRFSTPGAGFEVRGAVDSLINSVAEAAATSDKEIFNKRAGIIREEIAFSRENARSERANLNSRIGETRREIELRRDLISGEIELLQQRIDNERKLNDERRGQLEQFGRLLIESPDKFKETIDNINTATDFFGGVTDLNISGLQTILRRSQQLRGGGQGGRDQLAQVLQGLDEAVRFGRSEIISGIGNRQLQQVLGRVQIENLGELSDDLKKQQDEANNQSDIQRQIAARQRELISLAEFDAAIQNELVRLSQADAEIAVQQRGAQLDKLNELVGSAEKSRDEFVGGIRAVIAVLTAQSSLSSLETQGDFAQKFASVLEPLLPGIDTAERRKGSITTRGILDRVVQNLENSITEGVPTQTEEVQKLIQEQQNHTNKLKESSVALEELNKRANQIAQDAIINGEVTTPNTGITSVGRLVDSLSEQFTATGNRRGVRDKDGRRFTADLAGGRRFARSLTGDESGFREVVSDFRNTLKDNRGINNDFIDKARLLRGEGGRGRRDVDPEAVQRFLRSAGFEGAASEATTRGGAASVLDKFIELSERLADEQGQISKTTQKKIVEILGQEFTPGIRDVIDNAKAAADKLSSDRTEAFATQMQEAGRTLINAVEKTSNGATEAATKAVKDVFDEGSAKFADGIKRAVEDGAVKIGEVPLKVDVDKIRTEIAIRTEDGLSARELGVLLKGALAPIIGNVGQVELLSRNLGKVIAELVKRNIIPPIPAEDFGASDIFGDTPSTPPIP